MNQSKGSFLGEDDDGDVDGRPVESLMDCQESSDQHVKKMSEASNEAMGSYVFKTNDLCMITGCAKNEAGQSLGTVIKIDEGGDMIFKGIEA
jgi:hypothetical protein